MTRPLVMIRHGATDWTEANLLQGHANRELSQSGRQSVESLKPLLADIDIGYFVSSDLSRCAQTAEILGYTLDSVSPCWREIDAGDWSGKHVEPLRERLEEWQLGKMVPPNGESRRRFSARIRDALTSLSSVNAKAIVLVTHGQVVREVVRLVVGMSLERLALPEPASATAVDLSQRRLITYGAQSTLSRLCTGEPAIAERA